MGYVVVEQAGLATVMVMHGEHDMSDAATVESALENMSEAGTPLLIDLSQAAFLDSTVVGVLIVGALKRQNSGGLIAVVEPQQRAARRAFELMGLGQHIGVFPSRAAALQALDEQV